MRVVPGSGYVDGMTQTPDHGIDPELVDEESLDNTDVEGQLEKDPEDQANRENAPDPDDIPDPRSDAKKA